MRGTLLALCAAAFIECWGAHNPDSAADLVGAPWSDEDHYGPDVDSFQYKTTVYPDMHTYSAGQYIRVRLAVSGKLSNGEALSTQEGKWQWLNTTNNEAGLMLVKHYVSGWPASGINHCNTTATADVLAYTHDLGSASGSETVMPHSSITVGNTVCSTSDPCVTDPDGQSLDGFATFELPTSFTGHFRVCFRKSRSAFRNDTGEPDFFSAYENQEVLTSLKGGAWEVLHSSMKYMWEEPYGEQTVYNLTATPDFYWDVHERSSSSFAEGDHAVLRVHRNPVGETAGLYQTASTDRLKSDQVKLVVKGTSCIGEVTRDGGLYPGTVLSTASGAWTDAAFDYAYIASTNGTLSDRLGFRSNLTEYNPHRMYSDGAFTTVDTEHLDFNLLAFTILQQGTWDVCYSSVADRALGTATYAISGTTYLSGKTQAPGGWRKLPFQVSDWSGVVVGTALTGVGWSSDDVTEGSWGAIGLSGSLTTTAALVYDTGANDSHAYSYLAGGDHIRIIPYTATFVSGLEVPDACWLTHLNLEGHDLLGPPSSASIYSRPTSVPPNVAPTDIYFYLKFPVSDYYTVCYRPNSGFWRPLAKLLRPTSNPYNTTWSMNDTRVGTFGPMQVTTPFGFDVNTLPYDYANDATVAVMLTYESIGCQPHHDDFVAGFVPMYVVDDVGLLQSEKGAAYSAGKHHSTADLTSTVYAWLQVPSVIGSYTVCFKRGKRNWQTIYSDTGETYLLQRPASTISYELYDTRTTSFGRFLIKSVVGTTATLDLGVSDSLRIVPNATSYGISPEVCDRSTGFTEGTEAGLTLAHCSSATSDPNSPCYASYVHDNVQYDPAAKGAHGVANVYHFLTLPAAPASTAGFVVCYQQAAGNWMLLQEQFSVETPGISLTTLTELTGGLYAEFKLDSTGSTFDLGINRDEAKLVLYGQHCAYPPVQTAFTKDLYSSIAASSELSGQSSALSAFTLPIFSVRQRVTFCMRQYRSTGENNWLLLHDSIYIAPSGVKYSLDTSIISSGIAHFRFISLGVFDTNPGRDAFKLITYVQACKTNNSYHKSIAGIVNDTAGVTDLGPSDIKGTPVSEATTVIPSSGGPYRVCYYLAALQQWLEIGEETDAAAIASVNLPAGTAAASASGLLIPQQVGVTGINIGRLLFSGEGAVLGSYSLLGGVETASGGTADVQFRVTGSGFSASDGFKLVMTQSYTEGQWASTGSDCTSSAAEGTETSVFSFGDGYSAPVFTLPLQTGRYTACYRWGSASPPTWLRIQTSLLSTASPYNTEVVVNDEIPVVSSGLFFRQNGAALTVEDHFTIGAVPAPSLTSGTTQTTSDWVRVIPTGQLCQNMSVFTEGAVDTSRLFVALVSGTAFVHLGETAPRILDTAWPPAGVGPYKLCYRKLSSLTGSGAAARAQCCVWTVVPSLDWSRHLALADPVALEWVASAPTSVTVGVSFTVSVRVVGANAARVPGRRLVQFVDDGPNGVCGANQRTCRGVGSPSKSWQCGTGVSAVQYGWHANNTIVWTDADGVTSTILSWGGECTGCVLAAVVVGAPSVRAPSLTFDATSPVATVLSCPTRDATSGYLRGATVEQPLYLAQDATHSFEVLTLTASGVRGLSAGGTKLVFTVVTGKDLLSRLDVTTDATRQQSASFEYSTTIGISGIVSVVLRPYPVAGLSAAGMLQIEIYSAALDHRLTVTLHVHPVAPVSLEIDEVSAHRVFPMPQSWVAREWPHALHDYGMALAGAVRNETTAADGHYITSRHMYNLAVRPRDAQGRPVAASYLSNTGAVAMIDPSGSRSDVTVHGINVENNGRLVFSVKIGKVCLVATPCTLHISHGSATGSVTTAVRALGTKLALAATPAPSLSGTVDTLLGPFHLEAVNDQGELDEWHVATVWPLIAGGDGLANDAGVSITDRSGSLGTQLQKEMAGGVVQFDSLYLSAPCAGGCTGQFLADTGLTLYETAPFTMTDNAASLLGSVVGGLTTISAGAWFTVDLAVLDAASQPTHWVREWVVIYQEKGASPFIVEGGKSQRMVRSALQLKVRFTQPCTACALRFVAYPREGWWTADPITGSWVLPDFTVTNGSVASQLAMTKPPEYVNSSAKLPQIPTVANHMDVTANPNGYAWYEVDRDDALLFFFEAQDKYGVVSTTNATGLIVDISVASQVGVSTLDGSGSFITEPLRVRIVGITLKDGKGVLKITFSRPCLQCLVSFTNTALKELKFLITVLPKPDKIALISGTIPTTLLPYGGEPVNTTSVWVNLTFVLYDGDALVYHLGSHVSLYASVAGMPVFQLASLFCMTCTVEYSGQRVVSAISPLSVIAQVKNRLNNLVTPSVNFVVAGRDPSREGTLKADGGASSQLGAYVDTKKVTWAADQQRALLKVLDTTLLEPEWVGFAALNSISSSNNISNASNGYVTRTSFPSYNWTTYRGDTIVGREFPITVQVTSTNGTRIAGAKGRVTTKLITKNVFGCGEGGVLTQRGGDVLSGNTTIWLTFSAKCERCTVQLVYEECFGLVGCAPGLSVSQRVVTLPVFTVKDTACTDVIVDEANTKLRSMISVGDTMSVRFLAVTNRGGHAFVSPSSSGLKIFLFNAVLPHAGFGFGTSDTTRSFVGNGGSLVHFGNTQPKGVEISVNRHGYAEAAFGFERGCTACAVAVFVPTTGQYFYLRTGDTQHAHRIQVATTGTKVVINYPPKLAERNKDFTLVQWHADDNGDRDSNPAEQSVSELLRTNGGGNGDGGVLYHTNGNLQMRDGSWAKGALTWRLRFSSACLLCELSVGGVRVRLPVYSAAESLQIIFLSPSSGVVDFGTVIRFNLLAADSEGNRDYRFNEDVSLALSASPSQVLPVSPLQLGDGGTKQYTRTTGTSTDSFTMISGRSSVTDITFSKPSFQAYMHFFSVTHPTISTAKNTRLELPAPYQLTQLVKPAKVMILNNSGDTAYEGNPYRVVVGITDGGFVSTQTIRFLEFSVDEECLGNVSDVSAVGGAKQRTVNGFISFEVVFTGVPITFKDVWCTLNFSSPGSNFTQPFDTHTVRLIRVQPYELRFHNALNTPPLLAVKGRRTKFALGVYGANGMRSTELALPHWVNIGQISCTNGAQATSLQQNIDAGGNVVLDVLFSKAGSCLLNLTSQTLPLVVAGTAPRERQFTITIQDPAEVRFVANITETLDFLKTGVPYPLQVMLLDDAGNQVLGDFASELQVEVLTGPPHMMVRDNNFPGAAFARKSSVAMVVKGVYTFQLVFSKPTLGYPLSFQVTTDFKRSGSQAPSLSSELIRVEAYPQKLNFLSPPPPTHYIGGTELVIGVTVTDLVGNAPTKGYKNIERLTNLKMQGVDDPPMLFTLVNPTVNVIQTSALAFNYTVVWGRGDGVARFKVTSPRLEAAFAEVTFQTPMAILFSTPLRAGAVFPSHFAIPVGLTVVDALNVSVIGDFSTTIVVVHQTGTAKLRAGAVMTKQVINGKIGFEFLFSEPGLGNTFLFRSDSGFTATIGPFDIISGGHTPQPPPLVVYTPPKVAIKMPGNPQSFDDTQFSSVLSSALTLDASNIRLLWVCPLYDKNGNTVAPPGTIAKGCVQKKTIRRVLVGSKVQEREAVSQQSGSGGGGANDGVFVEFQIVLRPSQGLQGSFQEADAHTKSKVTLLQSFFDGSHNISDTALGSMVTTAFETQSLGTTDLQDPPTPAPTVILKTPKPKIVTTTPLTFPPPVVPTASPQETVVLSHSGVLLPGFLCWVCLLILV